MKLREAGGCLCQLFPAALLGPRSLKTIGVHIDINEAVG